MIAKEDLYIMDIGEFSKNLFRMGNATWPKFDEGRARIDVLITKRDGIDIVIANGNGFSAFDHLTKIMKKPGKKIWKIKRGVSIPKELKLVKDLRIGHEGHYMIVPKENMSLKKYLGILEELGLDRSKVQLLTTMELSNVG
jgi:hypothetical protein